jgi:hypothetical protein
MCNSKLVLRKYYNVGADGNNDDILYRLQLSAVPFILRVNKLVYRQPLSCHFIRTVFIQLQLVTSRFKRHSANSHVPTRPPVHPLHVDSFIYFFRGSPSSYRVVML